MNKPFKILILSSSEYGDITSGQGVIVTHTLRCLAQMPNINSDLGVFRPLRIFSSNVLSGGPHDSLPPIDTLFYLTGKPIGRFDMFRGVTQLLLNRCEIQFLQTVSKISKNYDVAIWFGSAYDPVSLRFPQYCNCPLIFHVNDSISLFQKRQIKKKLNNMKIWLAEWQESKILSSGYMGIIYVSKEDHKLGVQLLSGRNSTKAIYLPNGIDIISFYPNYHLKKNETKITIIFAGVMFYQPNIDAALYLIKEIIPRIRHDIELRIVGREPSTEIINAAKNDERIVVTGTVNDMVAEYQAADIFIAPMISGAGIQNKILQAMSCGLPVITTSMCIKAFPETPDGVLIGDSADQLAIALEKLICNKSYRKTLGLAGRMFIEKSWSWEQRTEKLVEICNDIAEL